MMRARVLLLWATGNILDAHSQMSQNRKFTAADVTSKGYVAYIRNITTNTLSAIKTNLQGIYFTSCKGVSIIHFNSAPQKYY